MVEMGLQVIWEMSVQEGNRKRPKHVFYIVLVISISFCPTPTLGQFEVAKRYGDPAPYGEGIHPGIDYGIGTGTPIIAVSEGEVTYIGPVDRTDSGFQVVVLHGKHFRSLYAHLSKVYVEQGQLPKRGQLIGLSGASNNYGKIDYQHLHFGICNLERGSCRNHSTTYDPGMFWLGGQAKCFDPRMDYSAYSKKDITLPIACGIYAKALIGESKGKD